MPDGFAIIYSTLPRLKIFFEMENKLKQLGIELEYPLNSLVQIWDEEGEYERLKREVFLNKLVYDNDISFQWWWNAKDDIFCRIRSFDNNTVLKMFLDGLNRVQAFKVIRLVFELFMIHLKENIIGFVIDRNAYTEEYDWNSFFIDDKLAVSELPSILGLYKQKKFLYNGFGKCNFNTSMVESVIVAKKMKGFGNHIKVVILE